MDLIANGRQSTRQMSKAKRKQVEKREKKGRLADKGGSEYATSEDESLETMSMVSEVSSCSSRYRGSQDTNDEEEGVVHTFEDKLKELLDGAMESKGSPKRAEFLEKLCKGLSGRYYPEFLIERPATITDIIEKGLKRGRKEEQGFAAKLAAIVILQYGASPEGSEVQRALSKLFITSLKNESASPEVREKIACALAITTYIAEEEPHILYEVMEQLKAVFSKSCPQGENECMKMPIVPPDEAALHQTALLCWGLLLTVAEERAFSLIDRNLATVTCLLHSPAVDVRVAAGEVLATMYEIARERDSDFEGDDLEKLCEELHELATDSQKHRAKRDRRVQRASFRDVERAIRDGEKPDVSVRFGVETLKITTWEDKRTYDAVCSLLGSGMNHHLQCNPEVRTLFGLGAPLPYNPYTKSRGGNIGDHALNDKLRTKRLAKCRDKRLDIM